MHLCKLCLTPTITISDTKKSLIYYRCRTCGFIYLDDTLMVDKVREKAQYNQHNNSLENEGYVQMFESFIETAIMPFHQNIQDVLDFGSGPTPVFSILLEKRGFEVDIYDLYYAPKKVYVDKQYDLITSTEVFEHLSKPLEVLSLLVKHLNPNGYIVLMTKFPPQEDEVFLNWWYRRDPTHISFFTPKSFEVMAKQTGLKVLQTIDDNVVIFQKC
jgi:SAM-dependent methyltransferase